MTDDRARPQETAAFEALAALVRDWREHGKRTTPAGVKPALIKVMGGSFSESELGYATFRAFVLAAEDAGYVGLHRPEQGHWILLLPGENPDSASTPNEPNAPVTPPRLKAPVWPMFVEWGDDWRRLWDKNEGRAFWYPTADDGRPAWESDPERFAVITHASQSIQLDWMRAWAETLSPEVRIEILPTIGATGGPGEFRAKLSKHQLVGAWRDELRRRIFEFASDWAESNGIAVAALLDGRKPLAAEPRVAPSTPAPAAERRNERPPEPAKAAAGVEEYAAQVRQQLHDALDRLTVVELLELRLPAHSLLAPQ